MDLEQTSFQEWVQKRASIVRQTYSAFDCLKENGHGEHLSNDITAVQISCPFHGPDRRPSARYYPESNRGPSSVRCFKCQESWDSINLYAKFNNVKFMEALHALERRFGIKIPRRPDSPDFQSNEKKSGSSYKSEKWDDIPTLLTLLENKLSRVRDKATFPEYIKYCRVIDSVSYDLSKTKNQTNEMKEILMKIMNMMNETLSIDSSIDQ